MPLHDYGVLKGTPINRKLGTGSNPHYQILINDLSDLHRIAVNVKSQASPSELFYLIDEQYDHPMLDDLVALAMGFTHLPSKPGGVSLDYIRGNHFQMNKMVALPHSVPGPDNDLNEKIDQIIQRALGDADAMVYAFGEKWGPEANARDKYFGFLPGNGIHDIHMNQGNADRWKKDDGIWQDGGLIIHFPTNNQFVGIFLAFQSQCQHTDDSTGHCLHITGGDGGDEADNLDTRLQIVAAQVNSENIGSTEQETVILINLSDKDQPISGWAIADKQKRKDFLQGTIQARECMTIQLSVRGAQLSNKGGIITLLDNNGMKVHGVSYTKTQASREGWLVKF